MTLPCPFLCLLSSLSKQFTRDKEGELPLIKELMEAHRDHMFFKHPCILDTSCEGCPSVAHCEPDTPFPIPRSGYCRKCDPQSP